MFKIHKTYIVVKPDTKGEFNLYRHLIKYRMSCHIKYIDLHIFVSYRHSVKKSFHFYMYMLAVNKQGLR